MLDPDQVPLGVDITDAQVHHFTDAQPAAIRRHQQRPLPQRGGTGQQARHLLAAEDLRELLDALGQGQRKGRAFQRDRVEKPQPEDGAPYAVGSQGALLDQVAEVALNLLRTQCLGPLVVVLRQPLHGGQIRLLGARGHPPHDQSVLHPFASLSPTDLLVCRGLPGPEHGVLGGHCQPLRDLARPNGRQRKYKRWEKISDYATTSHRAAV